MSRSLLVLGIVVFACALSAVGLKAWITRRIELAAVRTSVCVSPEIQMRVVQGKLSASEKDHLVEAAARSTSQVRGSPFWWHVSGTAIGLGYPLLWSAESRAVIFDGMYPHLELCASRI